MWLDSCFGSTVAGIYFLAMSLYSYLGCSVNLLWSGATCLFFFWVVYGVK